MDVAGHRVLRSAATGTAARVFVGYDGVETVVLKVRARSDPRAAREIAALDRAAGEHVVRIRDVAADESDTVLVLDRLGRGTLGSLLEHRGSLDAGEAITVLAPLATTLDRLHAAGVAHSALSVESVVFADDGSPTLVGFGSAELFAPGAPAVVLDGIDGVVRDRHELAALASAVLARVTGERAAAARSLGTIAPGLAPGELASALFDLADPAAIRFDSDSDAEDAVDGRALGLSHPEPVEEETHEHGIRIPGPWIALIPDGVRETVTDLVSRGSSLWGSWSARRRRVVLGVGAAAVVLALGVAAIPGTGSTTSTTVEPHPGATGVVGPTVRADDLPPDPVEATLVLLAARAECIRELSALCLDAVDQSGSAALDEDLAVIRAIRDGTDAIGRTAGIRPGRPELVERLGDAALLELPEGSDPASVLLIRTDSGWRIRDYLMRVAEARSRGARRSRRSPAAP